MSVLVRPLGQDEFYQLTNYGGFFGSRANFWMIPVDAGQAYWLVNTGWFENYPPDEHVLVKTLAALVPRGRLAGIILMGGDDDQVGNLCSLYGIRVPDGRGCDFQVHAPETEVDRITRAVMKQADAMAVPPAARQFPPVSPIQVQDLSPKRVGPFTLYPIPAQGGARPSLVVEWGRKARFHGGDLNRKRTLARALTRVAAANQDPGVEWILSTHHDPVDMTRSQASQGA